MAIGTGIPHYLAARTLVVDRKGRTLLLEWHDPEDGRRVWFTPGGRIEEGETPETAALRELHEETGLQLEAAGRCLMRLHTRSPRAVRDEVHFLVRADASAGEASLPDQGTVGFRWWRLEELERSSELFHPRNLADLLRLALAGGPAVPLQVEYELE
jgi:8-oxo-dGTP pyrophosphatase MutT (NUDIX family)